MHQSTSVNNLDSEIEVEREGNWFEKMGEALYWKVIPPLINDPYSKPVPDAKLIEWSTSLESLRRASSLRCMCDGYEILIMKDLVDPIVCSDHPCVIAMRYAEVVEYSRRPEIARKVEYELERMQSEVQNELKTRAAKEPQEIQQRKQVAKKAAKKPAPIRKPNFGGGNYRVIRSGF